MPVPWLRILDAVIGVTDLARSRRMRPASAPDELARDGGSRRPAPFEARLAGIVVGALKEVFDRDARRLELEAEQAEAERLRAERALRLELLRQAAEREIARLRAIAGIAVVTWLGSLFIAMRAADVAARIVIAAGWLLLLGAVAAAFTGMSSISESVARERNPDGDAGLVALWLAIAGLALVALSVLL